MRMPMMPNQRQMRPGAQGGFIRANWAPVKGQRQPTPNK